VGERKNVEFCCFCLYPLSLSFSSRVVLIHPFHPHFTSPLCYPFPLSPPSSLFPHLSLHPDRRSRRLQASRVRIGRHARRRGRCQTVGETRTGRISDRVCDRARRIPRGMCACMSWGLVGLRAGLLRCCALHILFSISRLCFVLTSSSRSHPQPSYFSDSLFVPSTFSSPSPAILLSLSFRSFSPSLPSHTPPLPHTHYTHRPFTLPSRQRAKSCPRCICSTPCRSKMRAASTRPRRSFSRCVCEITCRVCGFRLRIVSYSI
jgi:hypothetical protein